MGIKMDKLFLNSTYELIVRKIFKYLNFDDVKKMKELNIYYEIKYFTYEEAIAEKNYANVEYLIYHIPFTKFIFPHAAEFGNRMIMELLFKHGCPLNTDTFRSAAKNGDLANMKWLKQIKCPWDIWTLMMAVDKENLKNIEWLIKNNCPWHDYKVTKYAPNGNAIFCMGTDWMYQNYMNEIIWLIRDGHRHYDNIMIYALKENKPEIAKVLRQIICK
jgi:hypothetical protein